MSIIIAKCIQIWSYSDENKTETEQQEQPDDAPNEEQKDEDAYDYDIDEEDDDHENKGIYCLLFVDIFRIFWCNFPCLSLFCISDLKYYIDYRDRAKERHSTICIWI